MFRIIFILTKELYNSEDNCIKKKEKVWRRSGTSVDYDFSMLPENAESLHDDTLVSVFYVLFLLR